MSPWWWGVAQEASVVLLSAAVGGIIGSMWQHRRSWHAGFAEARARANAMQRATLEGMSHASKQEYVTKQREVFARKVR